MQLKKGKNLQDTHSLIIREMEIKIIPKFHSLLHQIGKIFKLGTYQ